MKIFKSIESIATAPAAPAVDPVEALLDFQVKSQELDEVLEQLDKAIYSCEMFSMIADTITAQGGVTKSLEVMFGENFSAPANMYEEASKEAFEWAETAWQWVKDFFAKIIAWCRSLFTSTGTIKEKLLELKKKDDIQFPMNVPMPFGLGAVNKSKALINGYVKKMQELANSQALQPKAPSTEAADPTITVTAPAPAADPAPAAAAAAPAEDKTVVDTTELEKQIEDWMVAVGAEEKEKASKDKHIASKDELNAFIDEVIAQIDDSKEMEKNFKEAQKSVEAIIKRFERSASSKGSFVKVQKLTTNIGKIAKKVANKYIELGYMILQRAKVAAK